MKLIKYLAILLALSFSLNLTGVVAAASDKVFYVGYQIPAWKGIRMVGNKVKRDHGSQVVEIDGTSYNRDIQFKITCTSKGATHDFQTLSVSNKQVVYALGSENSTVAAKSVSILFAGTKTLQLRTANNWLASETTYSGAWWLSLNDWKTQYGGNPKVGNGITTKIKG